MSVLAQEVSGSAEESVVLRDWRDFMGGLGDNSVDLVLTDPPYAISRDTGFSNVKRGVERFAVSMDFGDWDHKEIDLMGFCGSCYRVLRQGGTVIIWYDLWKISDLHGALRDSGFRMLRMIIWEKTNPVPLNQSSTYLSNSREVAVVGVKGGRPVFNGKYDNGVYRFAIPRHGGKRVHPTQKPLELFAELVRKHSRSGDFIIDPFLGSGTTAIAAMQEGRQFAGCDIDESYVCAARSRLRDFLQS